jgi:predicted secreted hydrolase
MNKKIILSLLILAVVLIAVILFFRPQLPVTQASAQVISIPSSSSGFKRATGPQPIQFPGDFGPHPDYQTEWWYYIGNLVTAEGRHFGYQLTFFRSAMTPPSDLPTRSSSWAVQQVYMAHFTLTDVSGKHFQYAEKFARGSAGLAGAQSTPVFQVWLNNWMVTQNSDQTYRVQADNAGMAIDLILTDLKGPILQGDRGYSQKGADPGNASYYFSQPRLETTGVIQSGNLSYKVHGFSWMDHEYSTSALAPQLVGWDWYALQLNDGSELMVYTLRSQDGSIDAFSSGTYIAPDGSTTPLRKQDFDINISSTWQSPHSKATYPARWRLSIPSLNLTLDIDPYLPDQELNLSFIYWEGAVHLSGQHGSQPVTGSGYIEMTGYAHSMQGKF